MGTGWWEKDARYRRQDAGWGKERTKGENGVWCMVYGSLKKRGGDDFGLMTAEAHVYEWGWRWFPSSRASRDWILVDRLYRHGSFVERWFELR